MPCLGASVTCIERHPEWTTPGDADGVAHEWPCYGMNVSCNEHMEQNTVGEPMYM